MVRWGYLACALSLLACGDDDRAAIEDNATGDGDAGEHADAGRDAGDGTCDGCDDDMSIHLHHVHLNVSDRARSMAFYKEHFGATEVSDDADALRAQTVLLRFDEVDPAPKSGLPTTLQHVGFGSSDPVAWFDTAAAAGVEADTRGHTLFNTDDKPTVAGPGSLLEASLGIPVPACFPVADELAYIYVLGPDLERIELWSGVDGRINHVHFTTADPAATLAWYGALLDLDADTGSFFLDDILFFFEADGEAADYGVTDDHVLDHLALSVTDLSAWRARVEALELEVVAGPKETHGFDHFFVRGPDGVLIELLEAAPVPGLCPDPD